MNRKEMLLNQIDSLPDFAVEKVMEFILFQRYSLGMFEDDTEYLSSIPGMKESIVKGLNTPISECVPEEEVEW
jgi:hypothetical protein